MKINTTLEYGGVGCTRDTIAKLTGMKIPYVALITFDGVVEMSNAVGGVPVCVAKAINDDYTGLHLTAGIHTLQGARALEFLRTRHGVGDGSDLTRISSQQVFLSALVRKVKSSSTLTDVTKLYGLAHAAGESMVLSSTLASIDTMVSIARAVAPISLSRFVLVQYPTVVSGDGVTANTEPATTLIDAIKADKTLRLAAKQKGATDGQGSVVQGGGSSSPSAHADAVLAVVLALAVALPVRILRRRRGPARHGRRADRRRADLLGRQRPRAPLTRVRPRRPSGSATSATSSSRRAGPRENEATSPSVRNAAADHAAYAVPSEKAVLASAAAGAVLGSPASPAIAPPELFTTPSTSGPLTAAGAPAWSSACWKASCAPV